MGTLSTFTAGVMVGLAAAAIGQELQKKPEERTWKGTVAGVPYNFRIPEWPDLVAEYWNPDSDRILSPHAIGLGWGVNFAAVTNRARQLMEAPESPRIPEPVER